jgi:hypothetical protein
MSVYVDDPIWPFGRMLMCHMVADTEQELHNMANAIGIKRRWFQGRGKARFPHYDICKSKRAEAIGRGAVEVDRKRFCALANAQLYNSPAQAMASGGEE